MEIRKSHSKSEKLYMADTAEFEFDGTKIRVLTAPVGAKLDINDEYEVSRGDGLFDAVVVFGDLFEKRNMSGEVIPLSDRWGEGIPVPSSVRVSEFEKKYGHVVTGAVDRISDIVNQEPVKFGFLNLDRVEGYQEADTIIARHQLMPLLGMVKGAVMRAGYSSVLAAGIKPEEIRQIGAKRLNDKENPNSMAVGLNIDGETIEEISKNGLYIRERAIATGGSLMALNWLLAAKDSLPPSELLVGTVGSQRGVELLLEQAELLGTNLTVDVGRLNYELTGDPHPYYLVRSEVDSDGEIVVKQQVGDGGDYGAWYCPDGSGNIWSENGVITHKHISNLSEQRVYVTSDELEIRGWRIDGTKMGRRNIQTLRNIAEEMGIHPDEFFAIMFGLVEES